MAYKYNEIKIYKRGWRFVSSENFSNSTEIYIKYFTLILQITILVAFIYLKFR